MGAPAWSSPRCFLLRLPPAQPHTPPTLCGKELSVCVVQVGESSRQDLGYKHKTQQRTGVRSLVPTYEQLKTLALSLRGEFPGHWNDFTIPDNDGSAQGRERLGLSSPRPSRGDFQKHQAFPIMTLTTLYPAPIFPPQEALSGPSLCLQSLLPCLPLDLRPTTSLFCFPILQSVIPSSCFQRHPPIPAVTCIGHVHLA